MFLQIYMIDMQESSSTLIVAATWCNHPELLPLHKEIWVRAFPEEVVKYIAYIDLKECDERFKLWKTCKENGINCEIVPQELHGKRELLFPKTLVHSSEHPSFRNGIVCQYAWKQLAMGKRGSDKLIFTQSDVYPFKKKTWKEWMGSSIFSFRPQFRMGEGASEGKRMDYAWEGLCGFDLAMWTSAMLENMNFDAGFFKERIFGDTGAGTWLILAALPPQLKRGWKELDSGHWTPSDAGLPSFPAWIRRFLALDPRGKGLEGPCYGELFDDWCFHLRAGSNWDKAHSEMLQLRFSLFQAFLYEALQSGDPFRLSSDQRDASTQTTHQALDASL